MAAEIEIYNPDTLCNPIGHYSNVARAKCDEVVYIAGQVALDAQANTVGKGDFLAQVAQTFANIEAALKSAGAGYANVIKFNTYLVHSQDVAPFYAFRDENYPKFFPNGVYPPNTLMIVDRLVREEFLIEIEAVAAI